MKPAIKTLLAVTLLVMTGCANNQVMQSTKTTDFNAATPIRMDAVKIEVVSQYTPRGAAPSVDHMMDRNPQQAVVDWAKGRLRAAGTSGYVQVKVKEASVTSRMLEKEGGVSGYFTRDQSEELVARLKVDISAEQRDRGTSGYTTVEASQILTVPEDANKAEREAIEHDLVNKLMTEFDKKAEAGIAQHLGSFLLP